MKKFLVFLCAMLLVFGFFGQAQSAIITYSSFTSYDADLGGNHDLFIDFDYDKDGNSLLWTDDDLIDGAIFSDDVTYYSVSESNYVYAANINQSINVEIGPGPGWWTGTLVVDYASTYYASAFTIIDGETSTNINLYNGATLLGTVNPFNDDVFQFFGFISDTPFDSFEVAGDFFAIDAHYSTASKPIPEPVTMLLLGSGLIGLAGVGRKKLFK